MIGYMGSQQKKQIEGLEELAVFTSREMKLFMANFHPYLLEQVHQHIAKASLAVKWLEEDVPILDSGHELSSPCGSIRSMSAQVCVHCVCVSL